MRELKEKFKEAISSILPIATIMFIASIILGFTIQTTISILVSTILLIVGVTLFTYGADLSMIEIGKLIASSLVKTKKPVLIILVALIVGIIITVAEPDLKVLATQMNAIPSTTLILCVGLGVGLFLSLAAIRILFQIDLKKIIAFFYLILIVFIFFSNKEMVPVAFDSGGVTTGPMSVPFIIAMGIGFSKARPRKEAKENSFGLVALCSIGPILTVLILGLLMPSDLSYTYDISQQTSSFVVLFKEYLHEILPIIKDVSMSLLPIVAVFIIYNLITKKLKPKKLKTITTGIIFTLLGLALFFLGVNVGYMPNAYLLGIELHENLGMLTILFGVIIGFVIVRAEPAVSVLTEQIEEMTEGSLKKSLLINTIACGVSVAVALAITRVMTGLPITWILVVGYLIAIILMIFTPKIFTMVAFDSGGAVSGPMTTSFLLPFIIGICYAHGGNVLTDAFGLVAFVALSPLITIQILGIVYKIISSRKTATTKLDETIIDFDWRKHMNRLSLLTLIINHEDEEKFTDFLNKEGARFKNIIHGTGTASDSVLEYFGLDEMRKSIILTTMPYIMSKHVLKNLSKNKKLKINEPGNGIAFTIPLSSATKYMLDRYEDKEMEDIDMKPANQHLIITIANEGSAEAIMTAAKKAGATGGTTINGRGLEPSQIVKFLGLALEPEKDVVLILAPDSKKTAIMDKIVEKCGSHKEQAGLCFSLPVDHVEGINIKYD